MESSYVVEITYLRFCLVTRRLRQLTQPVELYKNRVEVVTLLLAKIQDVNGLRTKSIFMYQKPSASIQRLQPHQRT